METRDDEPATPEPAPSSEAKPSSEAGPSNKAASPAEKGFSVVRLWPLAIIGLGIALFFVADLDRFLTLEALRNNRQALADWVSANLVLAIALYFLAYVAIVAFSLPGAAIATLTGGFLFGTWLGGSVTVLAATLGATAIFLAAKTSLGDYLAQKAGGGLKRIEKGFQEDAFNYLIALRLIPVFPFFLVNLAPAFLGVPLRTFVITTFIGIIPGTFVYAGVGNGLSSVFEKGETPNLGIIFEPQILLPILGLAALSLLPVVYRRVAKRPKV